MNEIDKKFIEHRSYIFNWIFSHVNYQKELAEDLTQELYIKIRKNNKLGNYKEEGKFRAWAIWVAKNMIVDYHRKQNRSGIFIISDESFEFIFELEVDPDDSIEEIIIDQEAADYIATFVKEAMKGMSEEIKKVFILRIWGNKSFKEIVKINDASLGTNLARMRYAKDHIKRKIEELKIAI